MGLILNSDQPTFKNDNKLTNITRTREYNIYGRKSNINIRNEQISSTKSSLTNISKNTPEMVVSSRTAERLNLQKYDEKLKNEIYIRQNRKDVNYRRSPGIERKKDYKTPTKLNKTNKIPSKLMKIQHNENNEVSDIEICEKKNKDLNENQDAAYRHKPICCSRWDDYVYYISVYLDLLEKN